MCRLVLSGVHAPPRLRIILQPLSGLRPCNNSRPWRSSLASKECAKFMKFHPYLSLLSAAAVCIVHELHAQAPAFDHIVIVIEENHSFSQIIGSSAAPNINALAAAGANIVNASTDPNSNISGSHAVRHPSQPNYLELYSGSSQGTIQDGHPGSTSEPFSSPPPFTTPNLGAALRNAGFSFAAYSQTMPSVGFDGDSFGGSPGYQRKHNPVANWMKDTS